MKKEKKEPCPVCDDACIVLIYDPRNKETNGQIKPEERPCPRGCKKKPIFDPAWTSTDERIPKGCIGMTEGNRIRIFRLPEQENGLLTELESIPKEKR